MCGWHTGQGLRNPLPSGVQGAQALLSGLWCVHPTKWPVTVLHICRVKATSQACMIRHHCLRTTGSKPSQGPMGGGQLSIGSHFCLSFPRRGHSLMRHMCMRADERGACRPSSGSEGGSNTSTVLSRSFQSRDFGAQWGCCRFIVARVTSGTIR